MKLLLGSIRTMSCLFVFCFFGLINSLMVVDNPSLGYGFKHLHVVISWLSCIGTSYLCYDDGFRYFIIIGQLRRMLWFTYYCFILNSSLRQLVVSTCLDMSAFLSSFTWWRLSLSGWGQCFCIKEKGWTMMTNFQWSYIFVLHDTQEMTALLFLIILTSWLIIRAVNSRVFFSHKFATYFLFLYIK